MIRIIVPTSEDSIGHQKREECFYVMMQMSFSAVKHVWRLIRDWLVWIGRARQIRQSKSCLNPADA